jgi:hypothetical protein
MTAQGWIYLTDPILGAQATHSFGSGVHTLDSTPATGDSAGFFTRIDALGFVHPQMPTLDRQSGYTVRFEVRVDSEAHSSNNRAGFSFLAVGDDLRAIELAFWTNEIWAQSGPNSTDASEALFSHTVESSGTVDTTPLTLYELRVLGDSYALWSGQTQLLSGPMRDYSSHSHPVYSQANTIFLGDDAGSAAAEVGIAYVEVVTNTAPEPGSFGLMLAGVLAALGLRYWLRKRAA